jgi:hypothetical protein
MEHKEGRPTGTQRSGETALGGKWWSTWVAARRSELLLRLGRWFGVGFEISNSLANQKECKRATMNWIVLDSFVGFGTHFESAGPARRHRIGELTESKDHRVLILPSVNNSKTPISGTHRSSSILCSATLGKVSRG